jgi:hypothetical protein
VGKYGTNLEGFGAFEGGVNADKGAPLVSTSSDGETALLFGPAALREIKAGVANGDFAIPPDAAGDTITESNPLPYWTFTDVNSAGAITCAIVEDSTAPSGFALQWSVAAGTLTGKSATISRNVTIVPGVGTPTVPGFDSIAHSAAYAYTGVGTADTNVNLVIKYEYYDSSDTDLTTTPPESAAKTFTGAGTKGGDITYGYTALTIAPVNAAYAKVTITCATTGTVGGAAGTFRRHNIHNVRMNREPMGIVLPGIEAGGNDGLVSLYNSGNKLFLIGGLYVSGDSSQWVARVSHTATQSLTNNTSTKAVLSTASSTPSIETYDPNGWFNNANDSIDIGQDGFYCVTANAAFASNATGRREVAIVVNGTTRGSINVSAASAGTTNLSVTTNLYLVFGDQVTITLVQTSGGALNTANVAGVYPALSVGRIGA